MDADEVLTGKRTCPSGQVSLSDIIREYRDKPLSEAELKSITTSKDICFKLPNPMPVIKIVDGPKNKKALLLGLDWSF